MPTNDSVSGRVRTADQQGETAARSTLDMSFMNTPMTATSDPQSFVSQSQDITSGAYAGAGVAEAFGKVAASGKRAASSLNIVAEKYRQQELKNVPSDEMQDEVDKLILQKMRVLPDMLANTSIIDYKTKLALANKAQRVFDDQIDSILDKKEEMEKNAESRALMKVQSLQAQADIIKQENEMDKFELLQRMDLAKTGQATMQDILEKAVDMYEKRNKSTGAGSKSNPFLGDFDEDFSEAEILNFMAWEKTKSLPVGVEDKVHFIARYGQWELRGKPIGKMANPEYSLIGPKVGWLMPEPTTDIYATDPAFSGLFGALEKKQSGLWDMSNASSGAGPTPDPFAE